jgi:N-acetylglutamate synthase-like GNAT family acetyltransferase
MIRPCTDADFDAIHEIINDAAQAYCGVIPADCWHDPYMPKEYLRHEIDSGVRFWGWGEGGPLVGVMGIQDVQDVTLIRHAYVRTANRNGGIGGKLLGELRKLTSRPVLIGTWAAATWAIRFYERHGFRVVTPEEKDRLLKKYWSICERQIETSVVLLTLPAHHPFHSSNNLSCKSRNREANRSNAIWWRAVSCFIRTAWYSITALCLTISSSVWSSSWHNRHAPGTWRTFEDSRTQVLEKL